MSASSEQTISPFDAGTLFSAEGIVAVVTGGGTGIGLMIATALEHNGATVYIAGRRLEILENAAKLHSRHGKLIPLQVDVTSKASITALVDEVSKRSGYINLLVNNSGVLGRRTTELRKPPPFDKPGEIADVKAAQEYLWQDTEEDWANTFATNVTGPYFTTVAFMELLMKGKDSVPQGSQVVTVSSIAAFSRFLGASFQYNASKAAAAHLAKLFSTNFAQFGLRSNVIAPGIYPSEMTAGSENTQADNRSKLETQYGPDRIPMQRPGAESDMAGTILFLASKAGAYLNGNVVVTDGGRLSILPGSY